MSNAWARTYDYAVALTPSNTTDDPAGPFSGLLVCAAGTVDVWTVSGPQAGLPLAIPVVAGQELHFPIRRVGTGGPTCFGLVSAIVKQGP